MGTFAATSVLRHYGWAGEEVLRYGRPGLVRFRTGLIAVRVRPPVI